MSDIDYFRWSDETVVREAKRMVSTTSSHIPRKKLIELLDLQQGDPSEESYVMDEVKNKLFKRPERVEKTREEGDVSTRRMRHRERARRRQTMDISQLTEASAAVSAQRERDRDKDTDTTPTTRERKRERKRESDRESDSVIHRTESVSSDSTIDAALRKRTTSPSSSVSGVSDSRRASNNSVPEAMEMRLRSPETTSVTSIASVTSVAPSVPSPASPTPSKAESVQSAESTKTESTILPEVSTCRYDGIEMPALDLDNLHFETGRSRKKDSLQAMHQSLEDLAEQSHSYSDNEKQLLEQMKKMQQEHENVVNTYEDQINELMSRMSDLKTLAEVLEQRKDTVSSPTIPYSSQDTILSDIGEK